MEESTVAGDLPDADAQADFTPAEFEAVAEAIPAPMVALDESGTVVTVNDAFEERLGYPSSALVGEPVETVCPDLSVRAVAASCDGSTDDPVTVRAETADGTERWFECRFDRHRVGDDECYVGVAHDVTASRRREQTLEHYERIVETIDDGVYVLDDAFTITAVNDAVTELTGYDRETLLGSSAAMLASERTLQQASTVTEALLTGDGDAATLSTTLETASGERVPVETQFSVYQHGDGQYGQVGVVRDVSDRLRYEQTLTALHDSSRELLHAETRADVSEHVVEMASDVLDCSASVVYLFDSDVNVLRPSATAADAGVPTGDLPLVRSSGNALWETFVTEERRFDHDCDPLELDERVEVPGESGVYVPLGDQGVLFVSVTEADSLDPDTLQLIDLVAASAEAALERMDRDERLRERERELREQNERLGRLEQINEIIRHIDQALVDADARADVESAVCEHLAESPLFSMAWIGRVDDDEVVPQDFAGSDGQYLDSIDRSLSAEASPPSVRTSRTDDPTSVPVIADDLGSARWRREALCRGYQSALSVPLARGDVSHGVLTVYATEQAAFTDTMRTVFSELGETIANALRTVETRLWLSAETVLEVDLDIDAPSCPLVALAGQLDASLDHEGTVPGSDGLNRAYICVDGVDPEAVRAAAERVHAVDAVTTVDQTDESARLEVTLSSPTVATTLTERGCRIGSLTAGQDGVEARVRLAGAASVRELVEGLRSTYEDASLDARREREVETGSESSFRASARDRLTDRQWEVLRTAHLSGFFEWPRASTGEDIAESFDVSQPTINRHVRVGQEKLLDLLFDE